MNKINQKILLQQISLSGSAFIPPQVLNEALAKEIVFYGSCNRFLYKN